LPGTAGGISSGISVPPEPWCTCAAVHLFTDIAHLFHFGETAQTSGAFTIADVTVRAVGLFTGDVKHIRWSYLFRDIFLCNFFLCSVPLLTIPLRRNRSNRARVQHRASQTGDLMRFLFLPYLLHRYNFEYEHEYNESSIFISYLVNPSSVLFVSLLLRFALYRSVSLVS